MRSGAAAWERETKMAPTRAPPRGERRPARMVLVFGWVERGSREKLAEPEAGDQPTVVAFLRERCHLRQGDLYPQCFSILR